MSEPSLPQPTMLERVAGSRTADGALTVIGAVSGGPLAALLPILGRSLAAERQRVRVETALTEIDRILNEHADALNAISDAQYKLINEVVLALLHTTSAAKIKFLKHVVRNTVSKSSLGDQDAVLLSRIVRDMSADEMSFLKQNFGYGRVQVATTTVEADHVKRVLNVKPGTAEALVVTGLVSLGLLEAAEPTWDETGMLRYSDVTAKLIALLTGTLNMPSDTDPHLEEAASPQRGVARSFLR